MSSFDQPRPTHYAALRGSERATARMFLIQAVVPIRPQKTHESWERFSEYTWPGLRSKAVPIGISVQVVAICLKGMTACWMLEPRAECRPNSNCRMGRMQCESFLPG